MDVQTIDSNYAALEAESQQTTQALTNLAEKLQAAAAAGDTNAREWALDLKEIAIGIRDEQSRMSELLTSLHDFVVNQLGPQSQPAYGQQQYPQQQYAPQPQYGGAGGVLQHFLGGGFGRAIATGAGFGIGDDIINHIL